MTPRRVAPPTGADTPQVSSEQDSGDSVAGALPPARGASRRSTSPLPAVRHGLWELPAGEGVPVLR